MLRVHGLHIEGPVQLRLLGHGVLGQTLELGLQGPQARVDAAGAVVQHIVQAVHLLARLADALVGGGGHPGVQGAVLALDPVQVERRVVGGVHHLVHAHVGALVVHDVLPRGQDHALAMLLERASTQLVAVLLRVVERDGPHVQKRRHRRGQHHETRVVINALV